MLLRPYGTLLFFVLLILPTFCPYGASSYPALRTTLSAFNAYGVEMPQIHNFYAKNSATAPSTRQRLMYSAGIIVHHQKVAEQTFHLTVETDVPLPPVQPGQFAMLRLPHRSDPLLARPFALYRAAEHRFEVVYLTVGKMTQRLAEHKTGDTLEFWLPLGNGFPESDVQHTIMVAGGIGQTPFLMLAEQQQTPQKRFTLLYGAKTKDRLACADDFRHLGIDVHIATDDGSHGTPGLVTELIETVYRPGETAQILGCGPKPMLHSAFRIAQKLGLPCSVSLETPMSCGLGICFGCVVSCRESADSEHWDYKRTCKDGPVFDAYQLQW